MKKFHLDGFIAAMQGCIPPVNDDVAQRNYKHESGTPQDFTGVSDKLYGAASWGLLLPSDVPDSVVNAYGENLFLLNLYSPQFLYPCFYVTDLGIWVPDYKKDNMLYFHGQRQAARFRREEFVRYHQALISEAGYGSSNALRMSKWSKEDWRLYVASLLYVGLQEYENAKEVVTWPRESADMATILEALFTAGTDDNSEVGYKLRKRAAALLAFYHPSIEKDIKKLYDERSSFVHGSFFRSLSKHVTVTDGLAQLPAPPFETLYMQKQGVREALVTYLFLNKVRRTAPEFANFGTVIEILEEAIINLNVRANVQRHVESILSLCADPGAVTQTVAKTTSPGANS